MGSAPGEITTMIGDLFVEYFLISDNFRSKYGVSTPVKRKVEHFHLNLREFGHMCSKFFAFHEHKMTLNFDRLYILALMDKVKELHISF